MKKFAFVLAVLCAIACLFVSCDTAADDDDAGSSNSLIGTWVSGNIGEEDDDPYYMKLVIREDSAAMVDSDDEAWEEVPEDHFDSFSISGNTATFDGKEYPYTLNGNTLTVTFEGHPITFTKQ